MSRNEVSIRPLWELNPIWDTLTPTQKAEVNEQVEVVYYEKNDLIRHEGNKA